MNNNTPAITPVPLVLVTLGGVYTIQSTISMLTLQGMPALLRNQGVTPDKIGLLYLLMLPWALKFLWAPCVERFRKSGHGDNHTRSSILYGNLLITLLFFIMTLANPIDQMTVVIIGLALITLTLTIVDTTSDGYAIDRLPAHQRAWANVMQVGGSYLGAILGSGLFLYTTSLYGWRTGVSILSIVIVLMALPAWFIRRSAVSGSREKMAKSANPPALKHALHRPQVRRALGLILLCMIGTRLSLGMQSPFMVDRGIDLAYLGIIMASGGALAGLIGVLFGGPLVRRCGALPSLMGIVLAESLLLGLFFWQSQQYDTAIPLLTTLYVSGTLLTAAKFVALYTLLMEFAAGAQSGVDFALMQSTDMTLAIICSILGGIIVTQLSYTSLFGLAAVTTLVAFIWLLWGTRRTKEAINAQ